MFNKESRYIRLYDQINNLLGKTDDLTAAMATINAILYGKMPDFFWVGFYLLRGDRLLVGPYQGPVACQELEHNKGVCWECINTEKTVIVADVLKFPGHIACDSRTKSEIAVPVVSMQGIKIGVLDIDSDKISYFDDTDSRYLNLIVQHMLSVISLP
jgi:L-methionine (R)-S-oxide reductase